MVTDSMRLASVSNGRNEGKRKRRKRFAFAKRLKFYVAEGEKEKGRYQKDFLFVENEDFFSNICWNNFIADEKHQCWIVKISCNEYFFKQFS